MELYDWAQSLLCANTIEQKLFSPDKLTDHKIQKPIFWDTPSRPYGMAFNKRSKEEKLPKNKELAQADKRAICLHRFAGHELLAIEIMAFALLAFPDAPRHFRMGIASTIKDEQRHLALYISRLKAFGLEFGQLPLYKHFWAYVKFYEHPLHFVSSMNLTFEMANLDFAPMYGALFEQFHDFASRDLMSIILHDEIKHVSFGWNWLKKFKPHACSAWECWQQYQGPLLFPKRAKGKVFFAQHRRKAGIEESYIQQLKHA